MRNIFADLRSAFLGENGTLTAFLFHTLHKSKGEVDSNLFFPQQPVLVEHFRRFIEYFLRAGCTFVSPEMILAGLPQKGEYALITFDDGYFNNTNALPLLKEYRVPAVFFITVSNVKETKAFWWDVIYRERMRQGLEKRAIASEMRSMNNKTGEEIDRYVIDSFGERTLKPVGDLDRPLTASELKAFSQERYVRIGHHCIDHACLTNYSSDGARRQIEGAQKELTAMTGISPVAISYPHGQFSDEVIKISADCGLKIGLTTKEGKNLVPFKDPLRLRRFPVPPDIDLKKRFP